MIDFVSVCSLEKNRGILHLKKNVSYKKIAIILRPSDTLNLESLMPKLHQWLIKKRKTIVFPSEERNRLKRILHQKLEGIDFIEKHKIHSTADFIISLGGDGTLIGTARLSTKDSPPIFGVNIGHLGLITEFSQEELFKDLDKALKKQLDIVKVGLYRAQIIDHDKTVKIGFFFNDAVFNKNDISRMINLSVATENELIYPINGDGLIVSSPMGSTGYSLAASGPIVHPQMNAMVITPICPHSFVGRPIPIVIPDNMKIIVKPQEQSNGLSLTLDGQAFLPLQPHQTVQISKSKTKYVKLIKNNNNSYFHTLRVKFTRHSGKRM